MDERSRSAEAAAILTRRHGMRLKFPVPSHIFRARIIVYRNDQKYAKSMY
jgi:hypothetical protein